MKYEDSHEWGEYCRLMKERPEAFRNTGDIEIITDVAVVSDFVRKTGKKIGVIYWSEYHIWLVDLVRDQTGRVYFYERLLPAVEYGATVIIPRYEDKNVLLTQYRHALRDYQCAFPRGFGEYGISPEENAMKEISEEIGAETFFIKRLGRVVPDSGCSGTGADVYVCDISKPEMKEGYEGIQKMHLLNDNELKQWIATGRITDGFSLAAWALLEESRRG